MHWVHITARATRFCVANSWKLAPIFWPILVFQVVANRKAIRTAFRGCQPLLNGLKLRHFTPLLNRDGRKGILPMPTAPQRKHG